MTGIYWYVSRQKVEALRDGRRINGLISLKDVSVKLRIPFFEASATLALDRSLFRDTERIVQDLAKSPATPAFPNLVDQDVVVFSFRGHAHRTVDAGVYWIAMFTGPSALLLAGSSANAIGSQPQRGTDNISPSANPIGAVMAAFGQSPSAPGADIGQVCSYVWTTIAAPVLGSWQTLPQVEGMASYGGTFAATRSDFEGAGITGIERVVVASPIFVRQVR